MNDDLSVEGYRISPVQGYLTRSDPSRSMCGWVQASLRLDREPAASDLDRVLCDVWTRHEALRTRLVGRPGLVELVQVVDGVPGPITDIDAGDGDPEEYLDHLRAEERRRISPAIGLSVVRVRFDTAPGALVITGSAAVVDEQSLRILCTELFSDRSIPLEDPVQYPDVAVWFHEQLADESRATSRARWADVVRAEEFSQTSAILLTGSAEGAWTRTVRQFDSALLAEVDAFAREVSRRPVEVCVAAWLALQLRLTGEPGVVAGIVVPARGPSELGDAIGPYARELPLLLEADPEQNTFRECVSSAMDAWEQASSAADDLDPRTRTAPVAVSVSIVDPVPDAVCSISIDRRGTASANLGFSADGMVLDHDTARLPHRGADDLLERISIAIRRLVATPDAPLTQVSILLPSEDIAGSAIVGPPPVAAAATLPELVAAQALLTPDAIAVDDGVRALTYSELSGRADALAVELRSAGVSHGSFAVLSMPRCCELLVGILGVLKSGAAYVPVDLDQPTARLESVVADVGAAALLRVGGVSARDDAGEALLGVPVVLVDASAEVAPVPVSAPTATPAAPDAPAYVMYTSGSTGVPNGVPVSHHALLNYLHWAAEAYHLKDGGGAIVHSPIGFDLTVTGLLAPLVVGQRVRLVGDTGVRGLIDAIGAQPDVTLVKVTPSQVPALVAGLGAEELVRRVRTLVCGGEQLLAESVAALRGTMRIVNEYGPTETVVGCVAHEIQPADDAIGPVPIGRPIAGVTVHLLDEVGNPVPAGSVGEIVVAGRGVGAGYLHRPAENAARFVADPMDSARLAYRTGDRARRNADGELVYLGRRDEQLKILGIRVEPGEVESTLCAHPAVLEAAVVGLAPADGIAATRLGAQVVLTGDGAVSGEALVAHCRTHLSAALVPAVVVAVRRLPLTANGKLDRRAVGEDLLRALPSADHAEPRDLVESVLCQAIADVLGREKVGIDDNYFSIGGDSIRSVMIASRAAADAVNVAVTDLHRWPTVRALAAEIADRPAAVATPRTAAFGLVSDSDRILMPADVEDAFPLNLLQEGMIFHRDFAAKSAVYHAIASVRLHAPLELEVMREVIRRLVARHPMLRTSFDQRTFSRPLQMVHTTFRDPLGYEDLRAVDPADHQRHIDEWVRAEKMRGFDLDEHPLIRFMVHRLDEDTFQFTYGFHHEIVDGWSEALMITELFTHYFSEIYGERHAPPTPASSMRDAVALELEALRRPEDLEFWTDYLDGASLMRLPRVESTVGADTGARDIVRIPVDVGRDLSDRLKALAVSLSMPVKNVLLAAHMAVMNHYHGQPDTLSYTVTNGRPEDVDGSSAIGLFVNSLALRLDMHGGRWSDLVRATLDAERRTMPYRRLPMAELKRHQGSEPLAETLFFFTDYHVFRALDRWKDRGVRHEASELYGESTFPFCAIFRTNRESGEIEVRMEYDGLQFPADLMERMAECYSTVLQRMVDDPDERYERRSLLGPDERRAVVEDVNGSGHPLGDGLLAHSLIRQQAERTPDRIALADTSGQITYSALVRESDRVADRLRAEGAGPEQVVGVAADSGTDAIVAMVGILASGAAYLPLDKSQPAGRLAAIIDVARPLLVLVSEADDLADIPLLKLPRSDWTRGPDSPESVQNGGRDPSPESVAYTIFTSGSTGEPKGVVVTHRNLVSSTLARTRVYPDAPEHFLLLSSPAVDSSVAGIFWTLLSGGTLHVPPVGAHREPVELTSTIRTRGITHTLAVPALLSALVQLNDHVWAKSLRQVIAAGDVAPRMLQVDMAAAAPEAQLHNEYGPTEASVWSNHFCGATPHHRATMPIGLPVPGARTYALDSRLHPAPLGVPAELYIGGAGVARGYLGRPSLTASAFLPDIHGDRPGSRMYRTGDLVRMAPDIGYEFLGRTDHQVKIRGYRVELSEVEAVLERHPGVRRAIAVARPDTTGEVRLHSYVVPVAGSTTDSAALLRYVRNSLPASAVPADVIVIDDLPLTRGGKVDRNALPSPNPEDRRTAEWVAPSTPTEELVAAVWSRVLGVSHVGRDDDFFALGGESLRAMNVTNGVNGTIGLELSVRALFDNPSLQSFAAVIDDARGALSSSDAHRRPVPVAVATE